MKTRWKILIALGIFMALSCAVSFMTMHIQPANEVEAYKKILREQGEKLEISEVSPPPVPAESNSLDAVEEAFRMFGSGGGKIPDAMKMVAPGKAMIGWMQPEARGDDNGSDFTNSWDNFAAEIAADRPAIELLHQVLDRPVLDFELDYKKGAELPLPHLAQMKRAVQKLDAATVCDLHFGDTGAAETNILTMLGLVQKNAAEGLLISHLVRIAITAIAVTPTWELLQATNLTDAQLAALQKGWEQMDFLSDATNAFVTERAWVINEIEKLRASPGEFAKVFGGTSFMSGFGSSASSGWWESLTERPRYVIGETMWRSTWSYSDELHTLKSETVILETLRAMQTNRSQFYKVDYDAMNTRLSSLGITNSGAALFRALEIPDFSDYFGGVGLGPVVNKMIQIETARRVVVAAIALKRFQLKHGKLPGSLDELSPEFFAKVPIDPYDGKPLRYHPKADGRYLLYSVGEDGVDDGGNPTNSASGNASLNWQRGRDS